MPVPDQLSLFNPLCPFDVRRSWLGGAGARSTFLKVHVPVLIRDAGPGPRGLKGQVSMASIGS